MSELELLRDKLYEAIDSGTSLEIQKASEELDEEIIKYMIANAILSDSVQAKLKKWKARCTS